VSPAATVLVVDDDESIRTMLRFVLESEGFAATTAANVPAALALITQSRFDVLISDLNIGHPADGFLIVSAVRRIHPDTLTFILTGYPAFETALEAMRQHVNDYLIKGTPIEDLVNKIKASLALGQPQLEPTKTKRVPDVIEENKDSVIAQWLQRIEANSELASLPLSREDRKDHVPGLLEEAIANARDQFIGQERQKAANEHGALRYQQGYTVPMVILEARLLLNVISECARHNFLMIDLSNLMSDLSKMTDTVSLELEQSMRAYTNHAGWRSRPKT
jgi:DNA-binding response OmpR family regulator